MLTFSWNYRVNENTSFQVAVVSFSYHYLTTIFIPISEQSQAVFQCYLSVY